MITSCLHRSAIQITFIFLLIHIKAAGQSVTHFNYTIDNGLPSSEVYDIHQDKKGFIWFATDNGIARFDGQNFVILGSNQGLLDPVVFKFQEDEEERVWLKTYNGKLSYIKDEKIVAYPYNDSIRASDGIINFSWDSKTQTLWYGHRSLMGHIDKSGNHKSFILPPKKIQIQTAGNGIVHAFGAGHKSDFNTIEFNNQIFPFEFPSSKTDNRTGRMDVFKIQDRVYFCIKNLLFEIRNKRAKLIYESQSQIISLSRDNQNQLWIGQITHGVEVIKTSATAEYIPIKHSFNFLGDKSVTCVFQDANGGYWFSTLENGIHYAPNNQIKNFNFEKKQKIKNIKYYNPYIFITTQTGEVLKIHQRTYEQEVFEKYNEPVFDFHISKDNSTSWTSTITRLLIASAGHPTKTHQNSFLQIMPMDSTTWCVGSHLVMIFDKNGNLFDSAKFNNVVREFIIQNDTAYAALRTGLSIRDKKLNILQEPKGLSNLKITDILAPPKSRYIMLSTMGSGVVVVNKKDWQSKSYDIKRNTSSNIYQTILVDSLIISATENGISYAKTDKNFTFKDGFNTLNQRSGLFVNRIEFLKKIDNDIWAFSENGFSIIPVSTFTKTQDHPRFFKKSIFINNHITDSLNEKDLKHNQNNIQINFGYICFNNRNVDVRYRVSVESPWTNLKTDYISLSSLGPGSYTVEIEYSLNKAVWQKALPPMSFSITPPWWRIWYFQLMFLFLALIIIWLYFKNLLALNKQKQQFLEAVNRQQQQLIQTEIQTTEKERSRIAKDLHDAVGTNLAAIKLVVGQTLKRHQDPLAPQIEDRLQDVIRETKDIIYNLAPPGIDRYGLSVILKNHIEKMNSISNTTISFHHSGHDVVNADLNTVILRIIQELISNSLKHAGAEHINIYISTFDDRINIIYEDNGNGFSEAQEKGKGFGLHNIQSRIEALHGQLKFESGTFGVSYDIDIPI